MNLVLSVICVPLSMFIIISSAAAEVSIDSTSVSVGGQGSVSAQNDPTRYGWYYDDDVKPTVIELCTHLCDNVQRSMDSAIIEVILGCPCAEAR